MSHKHSVKGHIFNSNGTITIVEKTHESLKLARLFAELQPFNTYKIYDEHNQLVFSSDRKNGSYA